MISRIPGSSPNAGLPPRPSPEIAPPAPGADWWALDFERIFGEATERPQAPPADPQVQRALRAYREFSACDEPPAPRVSIRI